MFLHFCLTFVAANEVPSSPLLQIRERITNLCVNVLLSYRKYCATVSSSGQLILPEALKLLPLYTIGVYFMHLIMYLIDPRFSTHMSVSLFASKSSFSLLGFTNNICFVH